MHSKDCVCLWYAWGWEQSRETAWKNWHTYVEQSAYLVGINMWEALQTGLGTEQVLYLLPKLTFADHWLEPVLRESAVILGIINIRCNVQGFLSMYFVPSCVLSVSYTLTNALLAAAL